jgi:hypothetical protein
MRSAARDIPYHLDIIFRRCLHKVSRIQVWLVFLLLAVIHLSLIMTLLTFNSGTITVRIGPNDQVRPQKLNHHPFEFAACLIIKDNNQILPEWLAYHYTVLPLRRLIVAVDPFSKTSPETILEQFRKIGMNITLWTDKDYFPKDIKYWQVPPGPERTFHAHIQREQTFNSQCLNNLRAENNSSNSTNHTWVALISSDEFIIFNYYHPNEGVPHRCVSQNETAVHDYDCYRTFLQDLKTGVSPRARLPSLRNKTVAHWISNELGVDPLWQYPCIVLPQVNFGVFESIEDSLPHPSVPPGLQNRSFLTLQFFNHEPKKNQWPGKSIVDISRFSPRHIDNVHIASFSSCSHGWGAGWGVQHYANSPLRIHHYIESLERYMTRAGDAGRDEAHYQQKVKAISPDIKDFSMIGWLHAFVNIIGRNRARELSETLQNWAVKDDAIAKKKFEEEKEHFHYQFFDPDDYQKYLEHENYLATHNAS